MDNQEYTERIQYHYSQADNLPLHVAHGVWGGVNPHGEIEISFYNESDIPPSLTEQAIAADGTPGPERICQTDSGRHISRHIHSRILVNYNTARAMLEWLEERL
ncbi:MAG: hypothetical protein HDQ44_02850, partial [Desulfovibrio sp.]|nr:hypothetical protein [Desulfovibrio sp.]